MNDINIWKRSSLLVLMLNGNHNKIDREFTLGGKAFKRLYTLVDGIYPSLSHFLGPETDPTTKLDGSIKIDQEGSRKDVERGYKMLKIKFLPLSHAINLHHRDDINCMVLVTILLHNMMVEECIKNDEVEDGTFYNTLCDECDEEISNDADESNDGGYENSPVNRHDKSKMVHRRWEDLYDSEA